MHRSRIARCALVAASLTVAGCGASSARPGARETLRAYGAALVRGDAATVTSLEHEPVDVATRAAQLAEARTELAATGAALEAAPPSATRTTAHVPLASGEEAVLVLEDGGWRLEGGALGSPALIDPRDAIVALRRALVRRDLAALLDVLARPTRAAVEDELGRVLSAIEDEGALRIDVQGDRATVHAPGGAVIELAREAGEWRVLDVRATP